MRLCMDRSTMTAIAHADKCDDLPDPPYSEDRPALRLGTAGGWFPLADKEHGQELINKYLPGARLLGCRTCFEKGVLRPYAPNLPQGDWDLS